MGYYRKEHPGQKEGSRQVWLSAILVLTKQCFFLLRDTKSLARESHHPSLKCKILLYELRDACSSTPFSLERACRRLNLGPLCCPMCWEDIRDIAYHLAHGHSHYHISKLLVNCKENVFLLYFCNLWGCCFSFYIGFSYPWTGIMWLAVSFCFLSLSTLG